MSIPAGTRLGSYEIVGALGAGGMGEVYRARDTKLGRDVALKVLPTEFALDAERLARFKREAQVLASLNDPHIAAIYGFEDAGGVHALVLELVEGPTLADRIAQGPVPLDEALPFARQIAEALEAAHEQGIIHRDLKPANIKVRSDGMVKVLDFGLAKLADPGAGQAGEAGGPGRAGGQALSQSPTITTPAMMTGVGTILGTAAYMSPEQAKGRPADKRSDVWAFGCVLYEMLTGKRAFEGDDVSETLASVLKSEPDWTALPSTTTSSIRRLLRRCLQKDRRLRLHDIGDARLDLDEGTPGATVLPAPRSRFPSHRREAFLAALALGLLVTTMAVLIRHFSESTSTDTAVRFEILPPAGTTFGRVELSPDGRTVAFVASSGGKRLIYLRPLGSSVARPLPGTEVDYFFWAPDGKSIGYASEGRLRRVSLVGGPPLDLATVPERTYVGTWSREDVILLGGIQVGGGLLRVSAAGGSPTLETDLDSSRKERIHTAPHFLPGGRHYLYVALATDPANNLAYVGSLGSKDRRALPGITSEVRYSPTGHVVFIRQGTLMAQGFDIDRLQLTGEAFPIQDEFAPASAIAAPFSTSNNATMAYRAVANRLTSRLVWLDRSGKELGIAAPTGIYVNPELSWDDRYVAFDDGAGAVGEVRILDLANGSITQFTSDPANDGLPKWSPDGTRLIFRSDRDGVGNLYEREVGIVGPDKLLLKTPVTKTPWDWSHDGRYVVYQSGNDVWALPLFGERRPFPVTETPYAELNARISPNGNWIAYQSNESGSAQIYVQSFPTPHLRKQASTAGGLTPQWSRDGKELFYVAPDRMLMGVSIESRPSLEVGTAKPLFELSIPAAGLRRYAVARDGRFLVAVANDEQPSSPITVVVNWASSLKQ